MMLGRSGQVLHTWALVCRAGHSFTVGKTEGWRLLEECTGAPEVVVGPEVRRWGAMRLFFIILFFSVIFILLMYHIRRLFHPLTLSLACRRPYYDVIISAFTVSAPPRDHVYHMHPSIHPFIHIFIHPSTHHRHGMSTSPHTPLCSLHFSAFCLSGKSRVDALRTTSVLLLRIAFSITDDIHFLHG